MMVYAQTNETRQINFGNDKLCKYFGRFHTFLTKLKQCPWSTNYKIDWRLKIYLHKFLQDKNSKKILADKYRCIL